MVSGLEFPGTQGFFDNNILPNGNAGKFKYKWPSYGKFGVSVSIMTCFLKYSLNLFSNFNAMFQT